MKAPKITLLGFILLTSSPALLVKEVHAAPQDIAPEQLVLRFRANWKVFVERFRKDFHLVKDMTSPEFKQRVRSLENFANNQKLQGGHLWIPLMNLTDNTLMQVLAPPPFPPMPDVLRIGFIQGQINLQFIRYDVRPLTPLEFIVFSRKVAFDTVMFQSFINLIPEDARIQGTPIRTILTDIVATSWKELPNIMYKIGVVLGFIKY